MVQSAVQTLRSNGIIIPFNRVTIGKEYKDYATKIQESQEVHVEEFSTATEGTPLENFIRSFWTGMRAQMSALTQLGVPEGDATLMFSDANFRSNVDQIINAFTDEVKSVIQNGEINAERLSGLKKVSKSWPSDGTKSIYLRVYTHQDPADANVEDFALYAGQSIQVQTGDYQHKEKIQTGDSHHHPHYSQAKNSLPEYRHMIPIMIFDEATPGALINMAQETAITAFNCVHEDFPETVSFGSKTVLMLESDHLNQTAAWVRRKGRTEAAPERASFEYNQPLIENQCGHNTLTNMKKPPCDDSDFWRARVEPGGGAYYGREKKKKCDLCTYMVTTHKHQCTPAQDLHNLPYHACRYCAMLNRYCTYTAPAHRMRDWGRGPPFLLAATTTLARFPTGSHRYLSFYRVQEDTEPQKIDAPFEGQNDLEAALKLAALDETEEAVADDGDEEYCDE
ncbi:unnamed protein product [Clonostachys byssicola]|uniref:Uncharacterized protein n=1 Tax=Clonostachys byssicola TaxID=160290 RepID=A0A9N9Y105_9HYPO|nr:unnamed protein product [Clonostachys byssicola]